MIFILIFVGALIVLVDLSCIYYVYIAITKIKEISKYKGKTCATLIDYKYRVEWYRTTKYYIYTPIYEYLVAGQKYQNSYPDNIKSYFKKKLPTGQRIEISYNEADPNRFAPEGSIDMLKYDVIKFTLLFIVLLIITIVLFMYWF